MPLPDFFETFFVYSRSCSGLVNFTSGQQSEQVDEVRKLGQFPSLVNLEGWDYIQVCCWFFNELFEELERYWSLSCSVWIGIKIGYLVLIR